VPHQSEPGRCPRLTKNIGSLSAGKLLNRFLLQGDNAWDFDDLVRPWICRALESSENDNYFEAFIFLWVTFNAWAAAIVANRDKSDHDRYLIEAVGHDPALCSRFATLRKSDRYFEKYTKEFAQNWPIFKVRALHAHGLGAWDKKQESRDSYRKQCLAQGLTYKDYQPCCYTDHTKGSPLPIDWPHTSAAIYQIRCNLFHGGKDFRVSSDQEFTRYAFEILSKVWLPELPRGNLR